MADYKTPGVYIVENNAFPNSAVAVETAIPVFIGYTEKAEHNGKSVLKQPIRISSFVEYTEIFGAGFKSKFNIVPSKGAPTAIDISGTMWDVKIKENNTAFFYNAIRLFYANGGGICYILSVDIYSGKEEIVINAADFERDDQLSVFSILEKEAEPTLIVIPDIIALGKAAYGVYKSVLKHCRLTQSRFGIFDLANDYDLSQPVQDSIIADFKSGIGGDSLNYGAAYYPWLNTSIVQANEINFENINNTVTLKKILPEADVQAVFAIYEAYALPDQDNKTTFQESLTAVSPTYVNIITEIRRQLNIQPPSGAMAGIYTLTDSNRGVWKAPANVSLSMVSSPLVNVDDEDQGKLNVDLVTGKSINVIRSFPGVGTLVWGARTLDGNSEDWRYINVRRTMIMLEQSLKLAARAYVFEPNDANTWITVKSMFANFLTNLWKQGALAGAAPEQAFDVQIGLGATMTPDDILDGNMLVAVKVAIVRPAEFIEITFTQQMQQS